MGVMDWLGLGDDEVAGHEFDVEHLQQLSGMFSVLSGANADWDVIQQNPALLAAAEYMAEHSDQKYAGYFATWEDSDGDKMKPTRVDVEAAQNIEQAFENGNLIPPSGASGP